MKKSLLSALGIAAIAWSAQAAAAGMGGINVTSALGQPLKADIELVSVDKSEKSSLVARLATAQAYRTAGLDFPQNNKFKFTIDNRANGEMFVHATSVQPINDPFVSLLVELSWASGRLIREFTFLLDPVGYQVAQPAAAPVQTLSPAVTPVVQPAPVVVAPVPVAPAQPAVASEPLVEPSVPVARPAKSHKQAVAKPAPEAVVADASEGDITVKRGDTLSKIAAANAAEGVSLERMMAALYHANQDQFDGANMNRIHTGKILRKPTADEIAAVKQADAKHEIHAQVGDWNAYRQKLASAAPVSAKPEAAQQTSAGKVTSSVADKTPVAKESAKEVLKLSKGEVPSDKSGATGKPSAQDKKNAAQEEAIAKAKAAEEERARVALLEKERKDHEHLAELKTQQAALAKPPAIPVAVSAPVVAKPVVASAVTSAAPVAVVSAVAAVSAPAMAAVSAPAVAASSVVVASETPPVVKPVPKPQPAKTVVETSLLDDVLSEPLYLGGGLAALLGLGGVAAMMKRRKKSLSASDAAAGDSSTAAHSMTHEMPALDAGDFTSQAVTTQDLGRSHSDDDPISEADLFMSFGRDAQAEEILQEALQSSPNKTPVKQKLLEIYAGRKDVAAFAGMAQQLHGVLDTKAWQQVVDKGRKLDPQNPLYGGAGGQIEDSQSATMQTVSLSAPVELPVSRTATKPVDDFAATAAVAPQQAAHIESLMDFDITGTSPSIPAPTAMDFDVTGTNPKAPVPHFDDMVFDVTSTNPATPAHHVASAAHEDLPFTLDFPTEKSQPVAAAKPSSFDFGGINLDLGHSEPAASGGDDSEAAIKLDLAKAYHEMGDAGGARQILEEVLREGSSAQRTEAQALMKQLG